MIMTILGWGGGPKATDIMTRHCQPPNPVNKIATVYINLVILFIQPFILESPGTVITSSSSTMTSLNHTRSVSLYLADPYLLPLPLLHRSRRPARQRGLCLLPQSERDLGGYVEHIDVAAVFEP